MYKEKYRPQYHFSAPKGWLNDPNGLIFYNGEYHLFYQYNPYSISWDTMHWGHAVSKDLVHWENLDIALYPDENGACFSGCCIIDENDISGLFDGESGLIAYYTGHIDVEGKHCIEHQCIAYSKDNGRTWIKYDKNPIIKAPNTPDAYDFRDPKVFYHTETKKWVMFLGGGFYRTYLSDNLIDWQLAYTSNYFEEFPDIFEIRVEETGEKKWILNQAGFKYFIGKFDGIKFIREEGPYVADYSDGCQATQTFYNTGDKVYVISWMRDGSRGPSDPWRNNMSVAREFKLHKLNDGTHRLSQEPVEALKSLRKEIFSIKNKEVKSGENVLKNIKGDELDLEIKITPTKNDVIKFSFYQDENQSTDLTLDLENGLAFLDFTKGNAPEYQLIQNSMDANYFFAKELIKIKGKAYNNGVIFNKDKINLRVLIDSSAIEIFFDDYKSVYSFMIYPDNNARSLSLTSIKGMKIDEVKVYEMEGIWK